MAQRPLGTHHLLALTMVPSGSTLLGPARLAATLRMLFLRVPSGQRLLLQGALGGQQGAGGSRHTPLKVGPCVGGALQEAVQTQSVGGSGNVLVTIGIVSKPERTSFENVTRFGSGESPVSNDCLLYTSPSPRDRTRSRMPSSA